MSQSVDKAALVGALVPIILFCDSKKESMRQLSIAGRWQRHHVGGKRAAYNEVKTHLGKLAKQLGFAVDEALLAAFEAAADQEFGFMKLPCGKLVSYHSTQEKRQLLAQGGKE